VTQNIAGFGKAWLFVKKCKITAIGAGDRGSCYMGMLKDYFDDRITWGAVCDPLPGDVGRNLCPAPRRGGMYGGELGLSRGRGALFFSLFQGSF